MMMHSYSEYQKRRQECAEASALLSLIGKPDCLEGRAGHLHGVECKATIYHQERSGAKNYHDSAAFNFALAEVVAERFSELSALAMNRLRAKATAALVACETDINAMAEAIRKAKGE